MRLIETVVAQLVAVDLREGRPTFHDNHIVDLVWSPKPCRYAHNSQSGTTAPANLRKPCQKNR
jgi:hypothetical protein